MAGTQGRDDFEALARQYWAAWGDAMRQGGMPDAAPTNAAVPGWQDAIDWWSRLARGGDVGTGTDATVERFNAQARHWYGQMQQLAARFSAQPASAADIAGEWQRMLQASGGNPFQDLFRAMGGAGMQGWEQWRESAAPYLDAWRRESKTMLGMPTFGSSREQQERWQKLAQAQLDCQQAEATYNALLLQALQRAVVAFQSKLGEREALGRQLGSARALFDLWIDAAEQAYAEVALSEEFGKAYGAMANAQMRLRAGVQREVEQASALFGIPTRSEVDAAHRKIVELERALRRVRDGQAGHDAAADDRGRGRVDTARATGKSSAGKRATAATAASGPSKLVGDPITGPLRNAAAPARKPARSATPEKPASKQGAAKQASKPAASKPPAKRKR